MKMLPIISFIFGSYYKSTNSDFKPVSQNGREFIYEFFPKDFADTFVVIKMDPNDTADPYGEITIYTFPTRTDSQVSNLTVVAIRGST
jgi:hypothetical protein